MVANYHPRNIVHAQLYVPEAAHLVTLIAGTGEVLVRQSVYGIVVNLLNAVFLARSGELTGLDVKALLDECIDPGILRSFGLRKASRGNDFESYDPDTDKERIDLLENLTSFLGRIMKAISGSSGMSPIGIPAGDDQIDYLCFGRASECLACKMDEFDHIICIPILSRNPDTRIHLHGNASHFGRR